MPKESRSGAPLDSGALDVGTYRIEKYVFCVGASVSGRPTLTGAPQMTRRLPLESAW